VDDQPLQNESLPNEPFGISPALRDLIGACIVPALVEKFFTENLGKEGEAVVSRRKERASE
jgi:hypothetical protein